VNIGVVISCYRQERFLPRTVAALERALEGADWQGVLELAVPSDAPLPALSPRWRVVCAFDSRTGQPGRPLTPGGGRMLGFQECGGDWVLFVDSDLEVDAGWMRAAIETAAREPRLGAIFGRLEEWFLDGTTERPGLIHDMYRTGDRDRAVDYLAALSFYRRDALEAAGGYDPRLHSDEDFELGLRFRQLGLEMRSLGRLAARHWSAPRPSFGELSRRWRTGICFGQGEVLKLYLGRPGFGALFLRQRLYVAALGLWLLGIAALVASAASGDWRLLGVWALVPLVVIAGMSAKKRSLRLGALSLATWTLQAAGMVVGFVRFPGGGRPLGAMKQSSPAGPQPRSVAC
jgi:hypothetical protein